MLGWFEGKLHGAVPNQLPSLWDPVLGLQYDSFLSSSLSRNTSENDFPPSTCLELQHMLKIMAPFKCLLEVGLSLEKIS